MKIEVNNVNGFHSIAERLLSKIFENVTRMPLHNPGYDFVCGKGFKIDVKSSCLNHGKNEWGFHIFENKIADYFLLLAFDNRNDLNPQHIWLIGGDEIIHHYHNLTIPKRHLNQLKKFSISNSQKSLKMVEQYEQGEKLEKLVACCNTLEKNT